MNDELKIIQNYIHAIEKALAAGDATEHTHRPALKAFIEDFSAGVVATNEPKHIECGAPDFILRKGSVTVGYIEAKDIGKSLDEAEKTDQLNRYRELTWFLPIILSFAGTRIVNAALRPALEVRPKTAKSEKITTDFRL